MSNLHDIQSNVGPDQQGTAHEIALERLAEHARKVAEGGGFRPSLDIGSDEFEHWADVAEAVDGTLAVTGEGRLIIYNVAGDINEVAERVNKIGSGFQVSVEAIDHDVLGFTY